MPRLTLEQEGHEDSMLESGDTGRTLNGNQKPKTPTFEFRRIGRLFKGIWRTIHPTLELGKCGLLTLSARVLTGPTLKAGEPAWLSEGAGGFGKPTLEPWGLGQSAFSIGRQSCLTLVGWDQSSTTPKIERLGTSSKDVWGKEDLTLDLGYEKQAHEKPLLLVKWSLGYAHFFLTMNLLRFLQVLSDGLPWLDTHLYSRLENLQLSSQALRLHQFPVLKENHEVTCSIQPPLLEGKQFEGGGLVTPHF